jgi:PHD/YefM family antitoxin component YafN of YafNO toxin-antitoxin module
MNRDEALINEATRALEQNVELANVTKLRQNLLPIIERFEDDPALRFLILKHGKPQAVLMSVPTYELMKKVLNQVAEQAAAMTREERIESAVNRLRSQRRSGRSRAASAGSGHTRPQVTQQLEVVLTILQQVQKDLYRDQAPQVEMVK